MTNSIRVYILSNQLGSGGVPRVIYNICKNLKDYEGISLRIGYLGGNNASVERLQAQGFTVEKLGNGFPEITSVGKVWASLRRFDADIVHTHMAPAALIGRLCAKLNNTKVVSTVHNIYHERSPFAKFMDYPTSHMCDGVISVSAAVQESLPRTYGFGAHSTVINNCIDSESVRERGAVPKEELEWGDRLPEDGNILANVARFSKKKGQHHLVRALPEILEEFPDSWLVMTGWGEMKLELKQLAEEVGVRDHVLFLSKVDNPYAVYYHSDIMLYPSKFEGFSIGLLEAMAFGKPIVANDIGPFVEALGEGYPGIIRSPMVQGLADAVSEVLGSEVMQENMSSHCASRIDLFSGETAAIQHKEFYRALMGGA